MKRLLALLLLLCSFGASAQTTIYYRNCDTGAHASCVNGNNGNAGTSASAPKQSLPSNDAINALAAGSNVRVCNGSSYVDANATGWLLQNSNATEAGPITVEGVDCSDGASGRPIFQYPTASGAGMLFGGFCASGCPSPDHGGYVLRGVRITRTGALTNGKTGITFYGSARYVQLDNVHIDNWSNGIEIVTTQNIRNLTIKDSYIGDNCQNGIVGSASDLLMDTNTFANNNAESAGCGTFLLQHATYLGGGEPQARITLRNNTYTNNSLTTGGVCGSGNATLRGIVDQFLFEENTITAPSGNDTCYGLSVQDGYGSTAECMNRFVARGNTIVNVGANSMLFRLTPGLLAENNRIVRTTSTGSHVGINIANPGSQQDIDGCPAGTATVRNNSIYLASGSGGPAVSVNAGSGHSVYNNLCFITAGASSTNCWTTAGATFSLFDYNWSYELGSGQYSGTYATRAAACSGASFDCNGGNTDPLLSATPTPEAPSMAVQSGSPLRSAGRNTGKPPRDVLWCPRDSTPDIGAHEYGGTPCLTIRAPTLK